MSEQTNSEYIPFPIPPSTIFSHKTFEIKSKGNLVPVQLILDLTHFKLKIEELDYSLSVPQTPITPVQLTPAPVSPSLSNSGSDIPTSPNPSIAVSPLPHRSPNTPRNSQSSSRFSFPKKISIFKPSRHASTASSNTAPTLPAVNSGPDIPTSPNHPVPISPLPPKTPSTPRNFRNSFRSSWRNSSMFKFSRHGSSSGYSTASSSTAPSLPAIKNVEQLPLLEIGEVRFTDYDSKTTKLNAEAFKRVKPLISGSRRHSLNKHKIINILHGKEFNLKSVKILVMGKLDSGRQQQKEQNDAVEGWLEKVRAHVGQSKAMGYFEKLDLWYRTQFEKTLECNKDNHRLKIWKHFLHRTHHRVTTESLQNDYDTLQQLVLQIDPEYCKGEIGKHEFGLIARYFVYSSQSISSVFSNFCPGTETGLLEQLEVASDQELEENSILNEFMSLFSSYFSYVQDRQMHLPLVSVEMDGAPVYAKAVIKQFAKRIQERMGDVLIQEKWLCSHYLLDYLFSSDNTIWSQDTSTLYQDMTHPLSHYWISTSHNTYLTGDQYSSPSSVETYARALRDGCRCIEIDVWDGPSNKPIVKHGRTLTTAINLKDVLITIKEHAFVTSPYPVIISIENHCNLAQQKNMAKYFQKIFGKMLVTSLLCTDSKELPSPEQLKYKIILKGRKLPSLEELSSAKTEVVEHNDPNFPFPQGELSTLQEEDQCDCLITGELWKSNDTGKWIPCIFVLTNKKLFYIEKPEDQEETGKLPNYYYNRAISKTQSVASSDSFQDLHHDQLWYFGKIPGGRPATEKLLEMFAVNGAFLVRESDAVQGGHTLCFYYKDPNGPQDEVKSVVSPCQIHTQTVNENETLYYLKQKPEEHEMFPSIFELIEYYKRNPLITTKCRLEHLGPPVPQSISHESQEWFYSTMDRSEAERILEKLPLNGAFLGRYKTGCPGEIVISFRFETVIKHCHIKREGRHLTVSNRAFSDLEKLVDHYSKHAFYKNIKLCHPVGNELKAQSQQSDCVQRVYACQEYLNSTVKTVKGVVRAIQSFHTSDPELLSFKKGDIIVNVIKESDGWWYGTRKDAEGEDALIPKQFPQSFVEDMEELEECPFGEIRGKGTWKLGNGAKVKPCKDKLVKECGIKYYIRFKYFDGTKKKLGANCSKRKVNEWVDMVNYVAAKDVDGRKALVAEKYKIASELSDLIVYCRGMEGKLNPDDYGWDKQRVGVYSTKSLDEVNGDRLFRSKAQFFVWYHQFALTRVYPKGFRLDSSNPVPIRFWNFGSQMVALNFQTPDKATQWNRGKFRQNGGCGYVLKPDFMRVGRLGEDKDELFDPTRMGAEGWGSTETVLTVQIISARHLGKPGSGQLYPIVEIEVIGVDVDRRKAKTEWKESGLNPYWNTTIQLKLRCPELALIQFSVCDVDTFSDKVLLGEATIPFPCIRPGYRSIQLQNEYGSPLLSTLLVHVSVCSQESTPL